jgi:hypothetical protein
MNLRHWRYGLVLAVIAGAISPTAASASSRANSFSGQCDLSGEVSFTPALTNSPQPVSQRAVASGTCSGEFTDRRGRTHELSESPTSFSESSGSPSASCAGGTSTGSAVLQFRYGKIQAGFQEVRAGGAAEITLTGDRGGSASALVNVSSSEDPADILARCAGPGLDSVRIDAHAATTPSISG